MMLFLLQKLPENKENTFWQLENRILRSSIRRNVLYVFAQLFAANIHEKCDVIEFGASIQFEMGLESPPLIQSKAHIIFSKYFSKINKRV